MNGKQHAVDRRILISFSSCLALCFSGCVAERSLRSQEPFARFIGRRFKTQKTVFLVDDCDGTHDLSGERKGAMFPDVHPTFEEFRKGQWKNKPGAAKFVAIIPAGTMVEIVDVRREGNLEFGVCCRWYGHIVPRGRPTDPQVRFRIGGVMPQSYVEEFVKLMREQRRPGVRP